MDAAPTLDAILGHTPVLPLVEAVLFPGVVLPLCLHHADDIALIDAAMAADGYLVVAQLKGEGQVERPRLHEIGCMARIIHAQKHADLRVDVLLQGNYRVRIVREQHSHASYRVFLCAAIPEPSPQQMLALQNEWQHLWRSIEGLKEEAQACDPQLIDIIHATPCPLTLLDILAQVLIGEPARQQMMLATLDVRSRLRAMIETVTETLLRYRSSLPASHRS